tara:strand:- start:243 stop:719 length:477 start_codon:yes stop_codon:yes gene_type:complete
MIYLGIGSNLGNKFRNIEKAKYHLLLNGIHITKSSSYYETLSWPDISKPKFINIVVQIKTKFSPKKLLNIFQLIEKRLGRKKNLKNAPRTCDIDIISYNKKILNRKIYIPHKSMHNRNFVLIPLYELDKNWSHPKTNESIKKLIFSLPIEDITSIKQI